MLLSGRWGLLFCGGRDGAEFGDDLVGGWICGLFLGEFLGPCAGLFLGESLGPWWCGGCGPTLGESFDPWWCAGRGPTLGESLDPWCCGGRGPTLGESLDPWCCGGPTLGESLDPWCCGGCGPTLGESLDPWCCGGCGPTLGESLAGGREEITDESPEPIRCGGGCEFDADEPLRLGGWVYGKLVPLESVCCRGGRVDCGGWADLGVIIGEGPIGEGPTGDWYGELNDSDFWRSGAFTLLRESPIIIKYICKLNYF